MKKSIKLGFTHCFLTLGHDGRLLLDVDVCECINEILEPIIFDVNVCARVQFLSLTMAKFIFQDQQGISASRFGVNGEQSVIFFYCVGGFL